MTAFKIEYSHRIHYKGFDYENSIIHEEIFYGEDIDCVYDGFCELYPNTVVLSITDAE